MANYDKMNDYLNDRIEKSLPTGHLDRIIDQRPEPGSSVPTNHLPTDVVPQAPNNKGSDD